MEKRGSRGSMRANAAGCIDTCAFGVSVVVYPEGTWYGGVKLEDVPAIVEEHLVEGRPVERLLMPFSKPKGGACKRRWVRGSTHRRDCASGPRASGGGRRGAAGRGRG